MKMNWKQADVDQMTAQGLDQETVEQQLKKFERGVKSHEIVRVCQLNDGILKLDEEDAQRYISHFENSSNKLTFEKFVPASGAATRMFRHLYNLVNGKESDLADTFFQNLDKFSFYPQIPAEFHALLTDVEFISLEEKQRVAMFLLDEDGLDFGNSPKGLIPFHRYEDDVRTAFEEHLFEGQQHLPANQPLRFHFTVAPDQKEKIKKHLKARIENLESNEGKFEFSFSIQDPNTDTIAVDLENQPFRKDDGQLLFRPGGHGALIDNLEKLEADIVFIKNIDNVVHEDHREPTIFWKKALGGLMLSVREKVFEVLNLLEKGDLDAAFSKGAKLVNETFGLNVDFPSGEKERADFLRKQLDRPIRIGGMVKNEGEPGGGPFWVKDESGVERPQIIEKAQINFDDENQKRIFDSSTHFNPVDLVCSLKRPDGTKYTLQDYTDPESYFIAEKSKNGKSLKALEHPGLWNGAMAGWNTIFVEVPLETFSPVKTVNDLLKKSHQPK